MSTAESSTIEGRIRSVDDVLRILQKSEHPIEREERIRVVAERLGVSQQRLIERYPALVQSEGRRPAATQLIGVDTGDVQGCERRAGSGVFAAAWASDARRCATTAARAPSRFRPVGPSSRRRWVTLIETDESGSGCCWMLWPIIRIAGRWRPELSMREDHFDDVRAHVAGCLETLDRKRAEAVFRDLITQLKAAEREGRVEDARKLNAHVNELRMQKAGRPSTGMLSLVKE